MILTTKGIDDLCLKEFIEAGAIAVRRCKKEDLRRIAKATGATLISSLANLEGEETFEATSLGTAEEVVQERISDDELILVKGTKLVSSSSIILRGANGESLLPTRPVLIERRLPFGRDGEGSPRLSLRHQAHARVGRCRSGRRCGRDGAFDLPGEFCDDPRAFFPSHDHR